MNQSDESADKGGNIGRRKFVNMILGTGAAGVALAVLYPVAEFINPPEVTESISDNVVAAKVGELKPNGWKIFPMGPNPAILIREADGNYVAFTAVCTHLGCTVRYRADWKEIWCPCHGGRYNLNGQNIAGPPPRPLTEFAVNVSGNDIVVSRKS